MKVFISTTETSSIDVKPHFHDIVELLYLAQGESIIKIDGQEMQITEGQIVYIGSSTPHSIISDNAEFLVIQFMPWILMSNTASVFESKSFVQFLSCSSTIIDVVSSKEEKELLLRIYNEFTRQQSGYELYIKGCIFQLVACMQRRGLLGNQTQWNGFDDIEDIVKYIEGNISENLNLATVAKRYAMSYSHFSRTFKRLTGRGFKQYLDFVRVCKAEALIIEKGYTASRAAIESGFCNIASFQRNFKRVRGYTPGTVRKIYMNENK